MIFTETPNVHVLNSIFITNCKNINWAPADLAILLNNILLLNGVHVIRTERDFNA